MTWVYFVSWTGVTSGSRTADGMSEILSTGPIERWSDIEGTVAAVLDMNRNLSQVSIVSYQLMRIDAVEPEKGIGS